jgi:hypothetical protein
MALILSGDTGVPASGMPTGSVVQTINFPYSTYTTTTSTSTLSSTGVTATITPTSASNKILVLISANGLYSNNTGGYIRFELYRNGSSISYLDDIVCYQIANAGANLAASYQYLDSPASTSAQTYALYWRASNSAGVGINNYITGNNRTYSGITLMEIKA